MPITNNHLSLRWHIGLRRVYHDRDTVSYSLKYYVTVRVYLGLLFVRVLMYVTSVARTVVDTFLIIIGPYPHPPSERSETGRFTFVCLCVCVRALSPVSLLQCISHLPHATHVPPVMDNAVGCYAYGNIFWCM